MNTKPKSQYSIAIIPGDTVGSELTRQAVKALKALSTLADADIHLYELEACGPSIETSGSALPCPTLRRALNCQAVLIGNIGSKRYQHLPPERRPEHALLELRRHMNICTNLRPVAVFQGLEAISPLKRRYLSNGFDILVVRDLQGGMLNGERTERIGTCGRTASDLEYYDESIISISARMAFDSACQRKKLVTSLDKSNVLASSSLWRKKVTEIAREYPQIHLTHQYIDNASMEVIRCPGNFDVILTSNVFGDILSDELAQLTGAPCLLGSAELAPNGRGIYTPNQLHHPFEEHTGKNIVHPAGILNATAMLLEYSCGRQDLALRIKHAIRHVLNEKLTTPALPISGFTQISTDQMGDEIVRRL